MDRPGRLRARPARRAQETAISETSETEAPRRRHLLLDRRLQLLCAMSLMTMVAASLIAPALPTIQRAFEVPTHSIGLVMTAFTLPGIFFIPITAVLADRYGRKAVVVPLLLLYGVAGGACSLATSFEMLLALRFLAGIGAGAIGSITLVLVGDTFSGRERTAAFGYRMAVGNIGNGLFPLVGGSLAVIGWQFPFLIFLIAVPVGLLALKMMAHDRPSSHASLSAYFAQTWAGLSRLRMLSLLTVVLALTMVTHGINLTFLPVFMEDRYGASAVVIGLVLATRVITSAAIAVNLGWLTTHVREERLVAASLLIVAVTLVWIPFAPSIWSIIPPVMLGGMASGIGFPAFQCLLVRETPKETRAGVMAANSMVGRFGQTVGPLGAGALFALGGNEVVFFGGAVFTTAMLVLLALGLRRGGPAPSLAPGE